LIIDAITILGVKVVDDVVRLAGSERLPGDVLLLIRDHIGQIRDVGGRNRCCLWDVVDLDLESWANCDLVVGKVPNHVEAMESSVGCRMRNPNFEFGVDPVEEEDWTCGSRVRHWGYLGALMDWRLRVLQGIPKNEVAVAIVGREVGSRIVELDLWIVYYISDGNW
jgi:hypothetical protein